MSSSELFFLIEVNIEKFVSHIKCEKFRIMCSFSDVFSFNMDPKALQNQVSKGQRKLLRKSMVRSLTTKKFMKPEIQATHSIIVSHEAKHLIKKMQKYPILISLRKKLKNSKKLGFIEFVWEKPFLDYLRTINFEQENIPTIKSSKQYTVLNDVTSQKIASFKATVKLSIVRNQTIKLSASLKNSTSLKCIESKANVITRFKKSANKISSATILDNNDKIHEQFTTYAPQVSSGIHEKETKVTDIKVGNKIIWNSLVKSVTHFNPNKSKISLKKSKSTSMIEVLKSYNILKYVYGDGIGVYQNRVYYVGYFTVATDTSKDKTSASKSDKDQSSGKEGSDSIESVCLFSEPVDMNVSKCKNVNCENKEHRPLHILPDRQVLLNLESIYKECCVKTEEVEGGVTAKMKLGKDPCFCTCECTFGYTKRTTYCNICGGYENVGEDFPQKPKLDLPIPCPVFHKMIDKSKLKLLSTSGSDSKKREESLGAKSLRTGTKSGILSEKRSNTEKKSDSEKDRKKARKANDDRFKFNYGYKAPQIGHCYCAMPCTGTLNPVPKKMGWLWTADNVPGLKYDPQWKPGAIHKFVYRLLKMARNPDEVGKKRRKDTGKKKRPLKRPLLVVFKQNGEYTVTMETMKQYPRPRNINQIPYEDKPALTYTIGRTDEENRERQKKKERQQRRLERAQRLFIQSAFKDMCHEICLKTYQQALGILPDAEDPSCPCYPAEPGPDKTNVNLSCSCSEVSSSFNSDTDSDEWVVEFTPPSAFFDPKTKVKKELKTDSSSQYTYLDYRVKLSDRYGNPVPRFFMGPDGKQQCSDLGGFWSPDHKWLEINIDGHIAPDGRWAPHNFIGPNGETVDAETGKFQAMNGKWLVVGIDGYVDIQGKWRFYSRAKGLMKKTEKKVAVKYGKTDKSDKTGKSVKTVKSIKTDNKSSWSCFGDVSPLQLSKMGITCHGSDRKLLIKKLQELRARGEKVKIPAFPSSGLITGKRRKKLKYSKPRTMTGTSASDIKCMHAKPSDKGIEAIDAEGNKTYFHLKKFINKRPKQRMDDLLKRGISLSSFHVPCLHSFINAEIMKQEQRKRLIALAARHGVAR